MGRSALDASSQRVASTDREFAALRGDDTALDEDVIAEVDVGLPVAQRVRADVAEAEHDLESRADAFLEDREAELAGVADEHHPPSDPHDLGRFLAHGQVPPGVADLREGVGAGHGDGPMTSRERAT